MFSFFKKASRSQTLDLSALHTDMHSHLIPGIDDGAKTVEDSITLVRGLADLGYRKLITTPHIMSEIYPNSRETISPGLDQLKQALNAHTPAIDISAAAEYYLDDYFDTILERPAPLMTLSNNLVLVEFSFVSMPINIQKQFFQMQLKGYQPVLAHPERYLYFSKNKSQFDDFKAGGCLFQLNLLSLTGYYGKLALELAQYLVNKGYIDLLGTDMHHARHLDTLRNAGFIMNSINKLLDSGKILNPGL